MTLARILTAIVAAASALLVAPISNAAPEPDRWVLESVAVPNDVWDQTNWAWDPEYPIIPHPRHDGDNQKWYISDDGTIRNVQYNGWCATSVGGKLAGRPCDGSDSQRWDGTSYDGYYSWLFELRGTDDCVTHNGTYKELILTSCNPGRFDQRWIIHKA
ncbi:ricin-type beta-trefoil lectin domain protein [Saccharothrix carnea]|nr:ricin-type beta-trefoil lectin domain protein [Saccharothrix carnea]